MASGSLQGRLPGLSCYEVILRRQSRLREPALENAGSFMLNCKLSGRTKSGSALTVGIVKAQGSKKPMPPLGAAINSAAINHGG